MGLCVCECGEGTSQANLGALAVWFHPTKRVRPSSHKSTSPVTPKVRRSGPGPADTAPVARAPAGGVHTDAGPAALPQHPLQGTLVLPGLRSTTGT